MKIVRYQKREQIAHGLYKDNQIFPIDGDIFAEHTVAEEGFPFEEATLLAPLLPKKLLAIGLNYRDHVGELRFADEVPTEPISFLLASSAVTGPDTVIELNSHEQRIDEEAELVAIIGKQCQNVKKENALDYIFGYTCGNDVSNRDLQSKDKQWLRGKSFPTYKPLGPWIETELDPSNLAITCTVNGVVKQQSNTRHLIFPVAELIEFLSSFMVLEPGDAIMTGTPSGVTTISSGDIIAITIEGIGTLKNTAK